MSPRPLRSWLYVPADDGRKIEKAAAGDADVVILDLEDGCPHERKASGRERVRDALAATDFGASRRYVRINGHASEHWRADLEAAAGADGIVLAKASDPAFVTDVAAELRAQLADGAQPPDLAPIVTEDLAGLFAAERTVTADELVGTLIWGSEDLSVSLGAWSVLDEAGEPLDVFRVVRSYALLVARRHGRRAIDTPWLNIGDLDGARREARAVARMGFTGKQAIHPSHIAVINDAFTPDPDELAAARELVGAFEASEQGAVVRVRDSMADAPHLLRARHLLELAGEAR